MDEVVRLLDQGTNVEAPSEGPYMALYLAAEKDFLHIVRGLMNRGALVDLAGGRAPLFDAAVYRYLEFVQLILQQ